MINRWLYAIKEWLDRFWYPLWYCRLRGRHTVKFSSHGKCYRCGKQASEWR